MEYQIIGSINSPYVRKLRLFMLKEKIAFDFKVINLFEKEGSDYLRKINPIGKVPVFLDGEQVIYDSRVIFNYLTKKHNLKPLTLDEENKVSEIDGAAETGVSLFLLRQSGMDLASSNGYIQRQLQRIDEILNHLEPWTKTLKPEQDWNFPVMGLYCFVNWVNKRNLIDINNYPTYQNFLESYKDQRGIKETEMVL